MKKEAKKSVIEEREKNSVPTEKSKGLKIDTKHLTIALVLVIVLFFVWAYYSSQFLTLSKQQSVTGIGAEEPVIVEPEKLSPEQSEISNIIEESVQQPEPSIEVQEPITQPASKPTQNEFTIEISGRAFNPKEVTVKPGTTVTWVNNDDRPHKVAAKNRYFYGDKISSGEKYSFTFNEHGEYDYFDVIFYRTMKGKIIVEEQK